MEPLQSTDLSKKLAFILRHRESETMDSSGRESMETLIQLTNTKSDEIITTVKTDKKQRFVIDIFNGEVYISATQGHTILLKDPILTPVTSAAMIPYAIHATSSENLEKILKSGFLLRMKRNSIHFATVIEHLTNKNKKTSFLKLKLDEALDAGHKFMLSSNNVLLCEGPLSVNYLKVISYNDVHTRKQNKTPESNFEIAGEYHYKQLQHIDVKNIITKIELLSGGKFSITDISPKEYNSDDFFHNATTDKFKLMRRGVGVVHKIDEEGNYNFLAICVGPMKFGNEGEFVRHSKQVKQSDLKVFTVKENGESGRFTALLYNGKWYAIVGSKNVSCMFSVNSEEEAFKDLESETYKAKRFSTALANAKLLLKCHGKNIFNNIKMFKILYSKNLTINFEAIFDNHIVSYGCEKIITFSITFPENEYNKEQEICMHPVKAFTLLQEWGFHVPNHDIGISKYDNDELHHKYRTMPNSEGAVVYEEFINEDGELVIHNIYKHKNYIYVLNRAARELIKKSADYFAWNQRFYNFHFNTDNFANEIKNLLAFYVWLIKKNTTKGEYPTWSDMIQNKFKDLLHEFNNELARQTELTEQSLVNEAPLCLDFYANKRNKKHTVVIFIGIPGSGKTTLCVALHSILGGDKSVHINQDELGSKKAFDNILNKISKNVGDKKLLFVDKCNTQFHNREEVNNLFENIITIEFVHPESKEKMKKLCSERIVERGIAHQSLSEFHGSSIDVNKIISNMTDNFEHLTDSEKTKNKYLKVNPLNTFNENLHSVIEFLRSCDISIEYSEDSENKVKSSLEIYKIIKEENFLKKVIYMRASVENNAIKNLINDKSIQSIIDLFPKKEEYHVTLWFNNDKSISKDKFEAYMNEKNIRVEVVAIAYNNKCVALKIKDLTVPCDNIIPHITLGVIDGINSVYANEMLESRDYEEIVINNVFLDLKINPVFKKY
jgi:RNA:NAD 2'-phosphotransferase (TPT1/KptA family)